MRRIINTPRPDLSEWVLHFVHDRNPEYEVTAQDIYGEDAPGYMPFHANSKVERRFEDFHFYQEHREEEISSKASAFEVICKIIGEGFIRSGWAFRGGKATVYGPKSAVCFTEMPLSSLVEYATSRRDSGKVSEYAIGLRKSELFVAGARPVIYGLSGIHRESGHDSWPRELDASCGISEMEQYRYVSFNLEGDRQINWTHEREWRWADHQNRIEIPALPIWRQDESIRFSEALVLVRDEEEVQFVLSQLRRQWDAETTNWEDPYNLNLISKTRVISLEKLNNENLLNSNEVLTIEKIPHHLMVPVPHHTTSQEDKEFFRKVISEAIAAAAIATSEWRKGGDRDCAGFAELVIEDGLHSFTRAGLDLELLKPFAGIHPFGSGGYWVDGLSSVFEMQGLGEREAAAEAAKSVIESYLPELPMHIWTRWD